MKFRFCSDGDCPLWALASLHALSSLPESLFKSLVQQIVDEEQDDGIMEILKSTSLSSREECARAAAVIRWVLQQTWRCACPGAQLTRDLLVLGVPRTHAAALAEAADSYRETYVAKAKTHGFVVNKVTDTTLEPGPEEAADTYKLTLFFDDVFTGDQKKQELLIEKTKAKELLTELKKAYQKMDSLENK